MIVSELLRPGREGILASAFFLLLLLPGPAGVGAAAGQEATDPSAAYLQAYIAFQDGGRFEKKGDVEGARRKYEQSLALFQGVKRSFPGWNPQMVDFRNRKVEEALQVLNAGGGGFIASTPPGQIGEPVVPAYPGSASSAPAPAPASTSASTGSAGLGLAGQIQNQIDTYEERIRQLQQANQQIRSELDSQKQVVKDSIARIAAAKNEESSALQRIAELEKELVVARKTNSERLAAMETEKTLLKDELFKATEGLELANAETSKLLAALEDSKAVAVRYEEQRDAAIKERDQMAVIVKTFQDNGDKALEGLIANNEKLQKELQEALDQVETLTGESREKDQQIARLEAQVEDVRSELAAINEKASGHVAMIADLEARLKATMETLEREGASEEMPEELLAENELLRGIIVRQLRQQVRQQQTNRLVKRELESLEGSSRELIDRVAKLTEERPELSDEERKLLEKYDLAPAGGGGISATMIAEADPPVRRESGAAVSGEKLPPGGVSSEEIAARAEEAFFAKDFARAEKCYEEFVKTDPASEKHGMALANLGVVRMRLKKFQAAQQALTKARAVHPDNAFIHFMLGMSHYWQGNNDDALLALESASQLDPANIKAHYYIGIAAARLGESEKAEKGFLEAIALDPRFAPAHFNLAVIYATGNEGRESYDRAEQHYVKAVESGAERDPVIERILNEAKALAVEEEVKDVSG